MKNLYEITALSFEKYMLLNKWTRNYGFKNSKLMVFESREGDQIAIPASESFEDFYVNIERILDTLEEYFGEKKEEIIKEIITSYFDRLEFRIESDFSKDGKLPLGYAADCIDGLKDLILYSTCAEQKAQPVCLRATNSSRDLMNKFKLAQTEMGSFIINIDTKVIEEETEQETLADLDVKSPLEHKVVERIVNAISQVNDVVEEKKSIDNIINDAYITGITANMCDALMKLKANEVQIDATIRYASALTRQAGVTEKIILIEKHFYVMDEISKKYRNNIKYEDVTLHGLVEEMKKDRVNPEEKRTIVLVTIIDGKYKRIHMDLSEEDYLIANKSLMNDHEMEISGELDMSNSHKWILNNPHNLKVL